MDDRRSLVLLPGSLCDAEIWAPQIEAFAKDFTIHTPELMGYDSIGAMAEAVLEIADDRFALAGFSMGARAALEVYRRAPERVERLALLDGGIHPVRESEGPRRQEMIELAKAKGMGAVAEAWLARTLHPSRLSDRALVDQLTAMIRRFTAEEYEAEMRALLTRPDAREVAPTVACPTLVLTGDRDPLSSPQQNEDIARQIDGSKLVVVADCGHFTTLEKPEETTAALRDWLQSTPN